MINIAINGFGRIGRHVFKVLQNMKGVSVIAINDLTDTKTLAHLLRYDTAYPEYTKKITHTDMVLTVAGKKIAVYAKKNPAELPWKKLKIDVVVECTGFFCDKEGASQHLKAGAKRVVISAPSKGDGITTYLRGINEHEYKNETVIDNASCTTNSLAPIVRVMHEVFGIHKAMVSTIHSYTADQRLQDAPHSDLRRARAAAQNIVPTSTGAAVSIAKVMDGLGGKFDGIAFRVPTITVSLSDFTMLLKKKVTVDQVNNALVRYAKKELKGVLSYTDEPLVSSDFIGNSASSIADLGLTRVVDGDLVKVVAWYDNEWGYANRLAEMAVLVGKKLKK